VHFYDAIEVAEKANITATKNRIESKDLNEMVLIFRLSQIKESIA
jgi:hypothetical protein